MSYLSQLGLLSNNDFRQRVGQAIQATAINVQGEVNTTSFHKERGAWAMWCLKNADTAVGAMIRSVVSDDLTTDQSTDANLQVRVANIWNAFSVVT